MAEGAETRTAPQVAFWLVLMAAAPPAGGRAGVFPIRETVGYRISRPMWEARAMGSAAGWGSPRVSVAAHRGDRSLTREEGDPRDGRAMELLGRADSSEGE